MTGASGVFGRYAVALLTMAILGSCGPVIPRGVESTLARPATPATAALLGVTRGPAIASLGLSPNDAGAALAGFRESCPQLLRREDASGLTRSRDWEAPCNAAAATPVAQAQRFFTDWFETARIGEGKAFATGYYEPEIVGQRTPAPGFVPVYGMPTDLVRAWPAETPESERTGRPPLGRYDESGQFVPYFDRAAIEDGALEGRAPVIAWAADPIEFFFLQVQGSGILRAPDGSVMRIGYAGQNGRGYTGIGALMRERGLIGEGTPYPTSMQGIMAWLRANPEEGRAIMRENQSWVFFRELTGDGPLGALGIPVRRESSIAADPAYVPLGAPVWLDLDRGEADGLWIAQDTGGAIKGANRFDTFWGNGADAREIAGGMTGRGEALLFLPKGTLDRLASQ